MWQGGKKESDKSLERTEECKRVYIIIDMKGWAVWCKHKKCNKESALLVFGLKSLYWLNFEVLKKLLLVPNRSTWHTVETVPYLSTSPQPHPNIFWMLLILFKCPLLAHKRIISRCIKFDNLYGINSVPLSEVTYCKSITETANMQPT